MLFELLDSQSFTRVLRTHQTIAFRTGEPPVFVFAGSLENLKEIASSYFHAEIHEYDLAKLYGLPVHEVKEYSIVLVGRQADIDRVVKDPALLGRAHVTAYPSVCPQCRGTLLQVAVGCDGVYWNWMCNKCSTVYRVENGILFIYDVKARAFVHATTGAAPAVPLSGLPSTADVSEQLPPLF